MKRPTPKDLEAWLKRWSDHCKATDNIVGMSWLGMVQSALYGHMPEPPGGSDEA